MPAKKNFHPYAEAQAAVRALGIIKQPEYKKRHREDPRLSSTPPKGLCQCRLDGLV